jgi:predicted SAM-dependent methyltransferase
MNLSPQVTSNHYRFEQYINNPRWCSFYHQIDEIISIKAESILEVGVGAGILGVILKKIGFLYQSLDFDPNLHPDHVGSVLEMPFKDNSYDVIGCFEVLEHLPFEQFHIALNELFRVASKAVIISLPDSKPVWPLSFYIPGFHKQMKIFLNRPQFKPHEHIFDGEHYWEINKEGYSINKIRNYIKDDAHKEGFSLTKEYRVWENPYHHFFVMVNTDAENKVSGFITRTHDRE